MTSFTPAMLFSFSHCSTSLPPSSSWLCSVKRASLPCDVAVYPWSDRAWLQLHAVHVTGAHPEEGGWLGETSGAVCVTGTKGAKLPRCVKPRSH